MTFFIVDFIAHQSQRFSEGKPEHNWNYHEESSSTNNDFGQQDTSYY